MNLLHLISTTIGFCCTCPNHHN